jgi:uncharacterized protein (TIGR00251 family)
MWVFPRPDGCELLVRVIPRASRNAIAGERSGRLSVRLAAPPVEGAANAALVELLAGVLGVPRRQVTIVAGTTSREKRVRVSGLSAGDVVARIGLPAG